MNYNVRDISDSVFDIMTIDTINMCSHLQKKLFEHDGEYYPIWQVIQSDDTFTAIN
jgi:hypothetical protein